jgi:hypothetical protein
MEWVKFEPYASPHLSLGDLLVVLSEKLGLTLYRVGGGGWFQCLGLTSAKCVDVQDSCSAASLSALRKLGGSNFVSTWLLLNEKLRSFSGQVNA